MVGKTRIVNNEWMSWILISWALHWGAAEAAKCSTKVKPPPEPPLQAGDYNGVQLETVCIHGKGPHSVFVIGDWGGISYGGAMPPIPADKRSKLFPHFHRPFLTGVDDRAQLRVAAQMRVWAEKYDPDMVLNVGDNFYWGGLAGVCGSVPFETSQAIQFKRIFEDVYWGSGVDDKPWMGVLGNHDFGGYQFTSAWDKVIGYTWDQGPHSTGRWVTPALYWMQRVEYPGFSVEHFFLDSNVFEAWEPYQNPSHNICGEKHSGKNATCGPQGPRTLWECHGWFGEMWEQQGYWLEEKLDKSTANWQIITTHMPPRWGGNQWNCFAERYGVDAFVSGHVHLQRLYAPFEEGNPLGGETATLISGGGGGITAENIPNIYGEDDSYGFMHIKLTKTHMHIEAITHSGVIRKTADVKPRWPNKQGAKCAGWPVAEHFVAADGGQGKACRAENWSNVGTHFMLLEFVPTIKDCQWHCKTTPKCQGIEYGSLAKVCELWTVPIHSTVPMEGMTCMRLLPGGQPDETVQPPYHARHHHRKFGDDRACRSDDDRHPSDYEIHNDTPSLMGCERICLNARDRCKGIEYGPKKECKVWTRHIRATLHHDGVICLPQSSKKHGARVTEVSEKLLHV